MKIFVGIPSGLSRIEKKIAKEEVESRYGADFGSYVYPVRNGKLASVLNCLAECDAAMFAKDCSGDEQLTICMDICKAFNIPVYK